MGERRRAQFQCIHCGHLYWIEDPPNIDEDKLYISLQCNHCRQTTKHLWVGEHDEDKYIYYDLSADPRYF